jgi:hypothetical protein
LGDLDNKERIKKQVETTKATIHRLHAIIKIGVILCLALVVAVGVMAILIINQMTDIAGQIADLNDLGFRRTLSVQASLTSKE